MITGAAEPCGEDALHAGLLPAPQDLGVGTALVVAGRLTARVSARPIILTGLALTAAATFAYTQIGAHTSVRAWWALGFIALALLPTSLLPVSASAGAPATAPP